MLLYQPLDTLFYIAVLAEDKALLNLRATCHSLYSLMDIAFLERVVARQVSDAEGTSSTSSVDRALRDKCPLWRWRWRFQIQRYPSCLLELETLRDSPSRTVVRLILELWKTRYPTINPFNLALDTKYYNVVRYLLDDVSTHPKDIGYIFLERELIGFLNLLYARGLISGRNPLRECYYHPYQDFLFYRGSWYVVNIPQGYEGGFYLGSQQVLGIREHGNLFRHNSSYHAIGSRVYHDSMPVQGKGSIKDSVYRYTMNVHCVDERIDYLLSFDSLDFVRGLYLLCNLLSIDYLSRCGAVIETSTPREIEVS